MGSFYGACFVKPLGETSLGAKRPRTRGCSEETRAVCPSRRRNTDHRPDPGPRILTIQQQVMLALEHAGERDEKIKHHLRTLDTLYNVLQATSPELRVQG